MRVLAADFFDQVLLARAELQILDNRLDACRDMMYKSSMPVSGLPRGSEGASRVELVSIAMVDAETAVRGHRERLRAIVDYARNVIGKIPQERYRELLTFRYVFGMDWQQVTKRMGYRDRNSVYRAHRWALDEAQTVLDEME